MKKLTDEKCREQFEDWFIKNYPKSRNGVRTWSGENDGDYISDYAASHWRAWQASRNALPILEKQERGEGEWIHWNGGECPVNSQSIVDVRYRIGNEDSSCIAGALWWGRYPSRESHADIIAYRIIPEQPTNQNGEQ